MSSEAVGDTMIRVESLTKVFRIYDRPRHRLLQLLSLGRRRYYREFTALDDVGFSVRRGEAVGIIGRNGSGKSTLLQLICGTLHPSAGTVSVGGRVAALLELGAGFNPEFTGRENVYFQGALMGFTNAQMDERFDAIAAFADIGEFIDQPVRTYSSGMFVRLAFSVAVHVIPHILIIDEALAVGDMRFQGRALRRLREMIQDGATVLVVSHDIPSLKSLCDRVMQLEHGSIKQFGQSGKICDSYVVNELTNPADRAVNGTPSHAHTGADLSILSADIAGEQGASSMRFQFGDLLSLRIILAAHREIEQATLAFYIKDKYRVEVLGTNTDYEGLAIRDLQAGCTYEVTFRFRNGLRAGEYTVTAIAARPGVLGASYFDWREDLLSFESTDLLGQPRWSLVSPFATVSLRGPLAGA